MRSPLSTLCYVEQDGKYLMLHRIRKEHDVNEGKWIGIGGHFEEGESPEDCLLREAREETGLTLTSWQFRGIVTFFSEGWPPEYICLYTADAFEGELLPCDEGVLEWIPKEEITKLNLWEGDRIFLRLLAEDAPFFSLKLSYQGDTLTCAVLDGHPMELFDVCDENGEPTGRVTERTIAHRLGLCHRTVHVWVVRKTKDGKWQILLQRRSAAKTYPLCYDVSAAGHIRAGDGYEESAFRELEEELGIKASAGELQYLGRFDGGEIETEFQGKPFHDREITAVYVCVRDMEARDFLLQEEEVESVLWMDYETCREKLEQRDEMFCIKLQSLLMLGRSLGAEEENGI